MVIWNEEPKDGSAVESRPEINIAGMGRDDRRCLCVDGAVQYSRVPYTNAGDGIEPDTLMFQPRRDRRYSYKQGETHTTTAHFVV